MGLDEARVLSPNRGGAPHQLPKLLNALPPEDATILRRILSLPLHDVDHANLRRQLMEIDPSFRFSASTLRRWNEEFAQDPERFA